MKPHYQDTGVTVFHGDCLDVLRNLPDESVHAVVTDPPYGLSNTDPGHVTEAITAWTTGDRTFLPSAGGGFMGKAWDEFVPPPAVWDECMRILKPGGHVLAFAGSRTVDLMALSIRLAGFDIRDSIAWLYGSGFPKSLDVAKAIDKMRDDTDDVRVVARWLRARIDEHVDETVQSIALRFGFHPRMVEHWAARDTDSQPSLPKLDQWDALRSVLGFGDEMDPEVLRLNLRKGEPGEAWKDRPVTGVVEQWTDRTNYALTSRDGLRRDTAESDAAKTWEGWGTALKPAFEPIVVARKPLAGTVAANVLAHGTGALNIDGARVATTEKIHGSTRPNDIRGQRYAQGSQTADDLANYEQSAGGRWPANVALDESQAAELDQQAPDTGGSGRASGPSLTGATAASAAYGARNGVEATPFYGDRGGASRMFPTFRYEAKAPTSERPVVDGVAHPTVKPLELMQWLVRLVTPKGGTVLEPFAGSGTTVEACLREGFDVTAIEREADYLPLIEKRIRKDHAQGLDFDWGGVA
jgi:DNA modification methylase